MKQKRWMGAALLLTTGLAQGNPIGYDYVDLSYRMLDRGDAETLNDEFDGPAVRISLGFTDRFYGLIENTYLEADGAKVDFSDLVIGGGYRQSVAEDTDFFAEAAWVRRDVDTPNRFEDGKDDGFQLGAGLRYMARDMLELNIAALYRAGLFDDNEAVLRAGGVWSVYGPLGVQGGAALSNDAALYDLGLRFSF
ncbi:MAG TPA: hypothetical protein PKE41_04895 [Candidatus Macondimonas sp.]|nr:hypothetical protein [Candidatus Macondimonas sp.]